MTNGFAGDKIDHYIEITSPHFTSLQDGRNLSQEHIAECTDFIDFRLQAASDVAFSSLFRTRRFLRATFNQYKLRGRELE